jgi:glycosyltransferase involved in cell wall biosynthesis
MYYRCLLPAQAMGADWCGIVGEPPRLGVATSMIRNGTHMPNLLEDYDVVVLQQPAGDGWLKTIEAMQENGVKVIFEIDDYLHGIKDVQGHDFAKGFDAAHLKRIEEAMEACDALIASTPYLKKKYKKLQPNAFVCQNGIDMQRYDFEIPTRDTINIGWAGATGHIEAVQPWFQMVGGIMRGRPDTCFVSIGEPYAVAFQREIGEDRGIAVPWAAIEQYPAAMTMLDIALAPGGHGGWWRGKSDLRWLEASSLAIPTIVNPTIYPEVQNGLTGLTATSPQHVAEGLLALIDNPDMRAEIGAAAQHFVREHRAIEVVVKQWERTFERVLG